LVGVGNCSGDCGEWIVDGGGTFTVVDFQSQNKDRSCRPSQRQRFCLLSPSAI
jgi:hypothetical protein